MFSRKVYKWNFYQMLTGGFMEVGCYLSDKIQKVCVVAKIKLFFGKEKEAATDQP